MQTISLHRPSPLARLAAVALLGLFAVASPRAQGTSSLSAKQTAQGVQRALERLPYYGVFDFLAFGVDRGTVTLMGYAYRSQLKAEAESAVARVSGVDEVVNQIEILPTSNDDDRVRLATYYSIYQDDFLTRYAQGGPTAAMFALMSFARFPGMQPFGNHAVHIVVKDRRTTLLGVVTSEADRTIAGIRAKGVSGVFEVDNGILVHGR